MNTIRIDRLDLKCRGLEAATARAALHELGPALVQHLGNSAAAAAGRKSAAIRVPARATPAAIAGAVAERVTAVVRGPQHTGRKSR